MRSSAATPDFLAFRAACDYILNSFLSRNAPNCAGGHPGSSDAAVNTRRMAPESRLHKPIDVRPAHFVAVANRGNCIWQNG
jgi:hypothetical protein